MRHEPHDVKTWGCITLLPVLTYNRFKNWVYMLYQRTIAKTVSITGIGIHSGKKVKMTLHPAAADTGIRFRRTDLPQAKEMRATFETVGATEMNTTIGEGIGAIHTVEHLFAVFYGLGIDNVFVEIDGPEVPTMDGSGASFAFVLKETGIQFLNRAKSFLVITEPVRVELDDKWAEIVPASKLTIDSSIVFTHPVIGTQKRSFEFSCDAFMQDISRARTFGFLRDVDMLKRKGLAKGGSLDNAVILDDFKVINPDGLRFSDEFVRHKILDTLGDISLLGHEIAGKLTTYKSGHKLHNMLCRKIMQTPSSYKIVNSAFLQKEIVEAFELPQSMSLAFL